MNLRQLRIGPRLGLGFGIILVSLIAILILSSVFSARNREQMIAGIQLSADRTSFATKMKTSMLEGALAIRNIGMQSDIGEIEKQKKIGKVQRAQFNEARDKLIALGLSTEGKKVLDAVSNLDQKAEEPTKEAYKLLISFNGEDAVKVIATQVDPLQQKTLAEINKLIELQTTEAKELTGQLENKANRLAGVLLVVGVLILLAGVAFAIYLTYSITKPLSEAVSIAKSVASGELMHRETVNGGDEISQLMNALKEMNDNLFGIVSEVRKGTDAIAIASSEMSSGNSDLSSRTESQAGSLEETASSMEELTDTVKHNADNARQANASVSSASEFALKGGEEVAKVVETMNLIKENSRKIVDIISVIDSIAFQTNILALNAAVEAARAGEQGRGFAVVASEVRNLAQRSATAAKEIKTLINNSVETVSSGGKLVDAAGTTMKEIVSSVKQVADIMSEITAAGLEQSTGIEEVNRAIAQMDEMTQQNAALVEQSAAAAESLEDLVSKLAQVVSVFKLNPGNFNDTHVRAKKAEAHITTSISAANTGKSTKALKLERT